MSRTASRLLWLLFVAVIGSALIVHRSTAVFAGDVDPAGGGAGPLVTDAHGPLFGGEPLVPEATRVRCAQVTYTDGPAQVETRMVATVDDQGLGGWLEVTIDLGTGGGYGDCAGFSPAATIFSGTLATLAPHDDFSRGLGAWSAGPGDVRTYRITTTLLEGAPTGATAAADFHWEVRAP